MRGRRLFGFGLWLVALLWGCQGPNEHTRSGTTSAPPEGPNDVSAPSLSENDDGQNRPPATGQGLRRESQAPSDGPSLMPPRGRFPSDEVGAMETDNTQEIVAEAKRSDADVDGRSDAIDNCLLVYNPTQSDRDHDRIGDA